MNRSSLMLAAALVAAVPALAQQPGISPQQSAAIDSLLQRSGARPDGAGCALGIAQRDSIVFERAWGQAQLEFAVPNTPQTIFEVGSVSKQFTAAAVLLLAQEGKLALDDNVRRWVPEFPDYGTPITLRHLLNHTSGIRDWGALASIGGWPRGSRVYTHAHVLQILVRQAGLNNPPGAEYIYSNSNYNLLAIIAERVSGQSLPEFTRARFFEPLGLTHTGWRDDYTRIVPGRAQAYERGNRGWRLVMPNENIYGNSSVLSTVGDLLRWDAAMAAGRVGGAAFVAERERRGRLNGGYEIGYAAGITFREYAGTREIAHDGATAGYRAFLGRYPDEGLSVALLCNVGNVNPGGVAHDVVNIVRGRRPAPLPAPEPGIAVAPERLAPLVGFYAGERDHSLFRLTLNSGQLQANGNIAVAMRSDTSFALGRNTTGWVVRGRDGRPQRVVMVAGGDTVAYLPVGAAPDSAALAAYAGEYRSAEADVTVRLAVDGSRLVIQMAPEGRMVLTPLYDDGFSGGGNTILFTRDRGRITGFGVTVSRARNVRFEKTRG